MMKLKYIHDCSYVQQALVAVGWLACWNVSKEGSSVSELKHSFVYEAVSFLYIASAICSALSTHFFVLRINQPAVVASHVFLLFYKLLVHLG